MNAEIVAYLTVIFRNATQLWVDEVAVAMKHERKGLASLLLRWAETSGRQANCEELMLWGHEDAMPLYEKDNYEKVLPEQLMDLVDEKYILMRKKIIYHL
jgi:predicted N-acetyltransferase YhbS